MNKHGPNLILFFACIILAKNGVAGNYCDSEKCVRFSSTLENAMDLNALNASCNNFASFSCGKFQNGLIHERYGDMTKEGLELDFATYKLMQFFETFQSESKIYKEAKKFFDSCMDEKQLVKLGNKPVLDIINELGGWINSPNSNSPSNWENLHNSIFKMGITKNFLIKTWLDNNPKNMSEYAIFIKAEDSHILDGGILDILENDEKQPEHIESYYNYMFDTYKAFYGDESVDKKVESSLNKIFKFEKLYTRVLFGRQFDERYEGKEEKRISYTIEKLQLHYPFMNWAKFFKVRLGMFESEDLDKNTTIIVDHPGFIANLNFFLKRQSDSSIQNFLMWKVVDHITTLLPRKLKPFRATLFRDAFGIQRFPEQWDTCFKLTSRLFPLVIANINVYNFKTNVQNSENLYEKLEDLVEMVKGELKNVLKEEKYLDLTAENIEDFSDYVETIEILDPVRNEVFTDERIENYYESIDFTLDDDYYSTVLKMRKFAARKRGILRYYRHVKDTIWEAHADIIDSEDGSFITTHFDPDKNYIYLGTKDLTSPNFDVTYPNFITYSGIGYEVAVAFYNLISYRAKHNYKIEIGKEKAECLDEAYMKYTVDNYDTESPREFKEDLLNDFLSFITLYRAYKKSIKTAELLPGIDLDNDKLFWVTISQRFCAFEKDKENTINKIQQGDHPINQFRIEVPMRFIHEFSNSFKCENERNVMNESC